MQDGLVMWRAWVFDAIAVLVAVAFSAPATLTWTFHQPYDGVASALVVVVALSLAFRRHAPVAVAWVVAATAAVVTVIELAVPGMLVRLDAAQWVLLWPPAAPVAAYSVMVFAGDRRRAWVAVGGLVVAAAIAPGPWETFSEVAIRSVMAVGGAVLLGLYVAARRRLLLALTERAERAEREQHLRAEQARADERVRLAAEIHDLVTHRVSLMVLQAGALRVTATDEVARDAAESLRVTGCQALEELRDLVGILRDGSADDDTTGETLDQALTPALSVLIAESESVGVAVELAEEGDPALVSPVVARTAHRIVQEALTNVRKHAPGAQAMVLVRYRDDGVHLTVRNSAPTRAPDGALTAAGSRTGLSGLRQRVELIDGALRAGPDSDGGFRLEATLPTFVTSHRPPP